MIAINYFTTMGVQIANCNPADSSPTCQTHLPAISASSGNLQVILQILFGIIAIVTVIFIIISAIRYQLSLGDPAATAKLRNSIIFAAIGLVITLAAEALVTFVLGRV